MNNAPIEVTTRFATTVEDLPAAWSFVMEHVDLVGPDPSVEISPYWIISDDTDETPRKFSVVVSGMVEKDKHE